MYFQLGTKEGYLVKQGAVVKVRSRYIPMYEPTSAFIRKSVYSCHFVMAITYTAQFSQLNCFGLHCSVLEWLARRSKVQFPENAEILTCLLKIIHSAFCDQFHVGHLGDQPRTM